MRSHPVSFLSALVALAAVAAPLPLCADAPKPAAKVLKAKGVAATDAVPDEKGRTWWMPRHEAAVKLLAERKPDILLIGDSITHWWGGEPTEGGRGTGKAVFDHYFGDRKVVNLGCASDRTYHVLWRLKNGELDGISPKVAVVMIGTNNHPTPGHSPEDTAAGVKAICALIREKLPKTKILLLGVFPRNNQSGADFIAFPSRVNAILRKLHGANGITYLEINDSLGNPDGTTRAGLFSDRLHPTAAGYKVWAEAMEPTLARLLGVPPKRPMPAASK